MMVVLTIQTNKCVVVYEYTTYMYKKKDRYEMRQIIYSVFIGIGSRRTKV
jgi:hypothetical protein